MTNWTAEPFAWGSGASASWRWIALTALLWVVVSALLLVSWFKNPAFGLQGDVPLHYHLTRSFARSLAEGDWFPRWAGLLDGGRGDAVFTFYGPLYYWLTGGIAVLFGVSLLSALKCVLFLSTFLAQACAYFLAREFWDRKPSLLASVAYVLLPAFPLLALNRSFLPNSLAISVAPLVLLGGHRLLTNVKPWRGLTLLCLGLSAVILTHAITTYLCAVLLGLQLLSSWRRVTWRNVVWLALAGILTLALTAFFWVPQIVELHWVPIGNELPHDYHSYFLFAPAADDTPYRREWAALNQIASIITLAQTALAFGLALLCRRTKSAAGKTLPLWLCVLIAAFGLFISLPSSEFAWRSLPGLHVMQFPWRWQAFVALAIALLLAQTLAHWPEFGRRERVLSSALLTWILALNVVLTFSIARSRQQLPTSADWTQSVLQTGVLPAETAQRGAPDVQSKLQAATRSANQIYFRPRFAEQTYHPPTDQPGGLTILSGNGQVRQQSLQIRQRAFMLEAVEPLRVRVETYAYPHWVARLDGQEVAIDKEAESGLMHFALPPGNHTLSLTYEVRAPAERAASLFSLLTWLASGAIWLRVQIRQRRPPKT